MRLVGAEFLKLYRRTGLVLAALGLTVVPALIMHAVTGGGDFDRAACAASPTTSASLALLIVVAGHPRRRLARHRPTSRPACSASWWRPAARGSTCSPRACPPASRSSCSRPPRGSRSSPRRTCRRSGARDGRRLRHRGPDAGRWSTGLCSRSSPPSASRSRSAWRRLVGSSGSRSPSCSALWLVVTPLVQNAESLRVAVGRLVIAGLDRVMPAGLTEGEPVHSLSLAAAHRGAARVDGVPLLAGAWRTMTRDA